HVKPWHNAVKTHFFRDHQRRRSDTVIYIIVKTIVTFYERKSRYAVQAVDGMDASQRIVTSARRTA
ncbi:hypothetical protein BGZ99_009787, partial [Dissophora globulifera]